jgi:hypothetical protein
VTSKTPSKPGEKTLTLSDADIVSERSVTRRSLLGAIGLGAGVAATVAFGTAGEVPAADSDTKKKKTTKKPPKKPKPEADND